MVLKEEVVVVAELLEGPVVVVDDEVEEVDDIVEVVDVEEMLELEDDETVWVGQLTTPFNAYKLNWKGPPQNAVPVVDAPIEPLQTSVQAWALVKLATLVTEDEPKLKALPP